ncbi:MAG: hypothetical protein Q8O17_01555 [Candidatus Methanoperedens sp.]|nr:hypothetical protein [Candidatus Methanoperedens sp.]
MVSEKRGGKVKDTGMVDVSCSICGMDMDCPESLLLDDQHFCPKCSHLMDEGYEIKDFMRDPNIG